MQIISTPNDFPDTAFLNSLLTRSADGDQGAFRELYQRSCAHLMGAALRILRDKPLAEEAVQEAFVQIWQKAQTYQPGKAPALAWMVAIARYRSLDMLRRKPRGQRSLDAHDPDSAPLQIEAGGHSPTELEDEPRLGECMDELSEQSRKAVLLAHVEGFSHGELAARLGAPLGTVKSWVRRGLLQLRDCLEGGGA